jgi:DNA-binding response OmpR family regulator
MNTGQGAAPVSTERRTRKPLRIVVADDDRDTVDMLLFILRDEGHIVHGVYTGREVLPAVRIVRPDAVILDIAIPGMSGYAVAQAIRNSFTDVRRPLLIALSGMWTEWPDRIVAHQVGFDHHLAKPYDSAQLLRLLASAPGFPPQA